jgi:hypothetical protein
MSEQNVARYASIWTLLDCRVSRVEIGLDRGDVFKAAGLEQCASRPRGSSLTLQGRTPAAPRNGISPFEEAGFIRHTRPFAAEVITPSQPQFVSVRSY